MVRVDWHLPECQDSHFPSEHCSVERWLITHSAASGFDVVPDRCMHLCTCCASSCLLLWLVELLKKGFGRRTSSAALCLILPLWQHSWVDLFMSPLDFLDFVSWRSSWVVSRERRMICSPGWRRTRRTSMSWWRNTRLLWPRLVCSIRRHYVCINPVNESTVLFSLGKAETIHVFYQLFYFMNAFIKKQTKKLKWNMMCKNHAESCLLKLFQKPLNLILTHFQPWLRSSSRLV